MKFRSVTERYLSFFDIFNECIPRTVCCKIFSVPDRWLYASGYLDMYIPSPVKDSKCVTDGV